jgi:hypothetical protein
MPCDFVETPHGTAVVCSRGPRRKKCAYCPNVGTQLCDYELKPGKTCGAPICKRCSTSPKPEVDYCRAHAGASAAPLVGDALDSHLGDRS